MTETVRQPYRPASAPEADRAEAHAAPPPSARPGAQLAIRSELEASDLDLIRVVEDLIAVLVDKGVIMMTDLPKAAQDKIASRGALRSKLKDLGSIVAEAEDIMLP